MKNKKLICSLLLLLTLCCVPTTINAQDNTSSIPVENTSSYNAGKGGSSTYAYDIRWVYKIENGITYRRQYNYTLNKWIGEWERLN